jgi:hypothetical protein
VFKLLTLIVVICAVISTLSISAAHYMFVFRHHRTIGSCEYLALTVLGVAISAITINAMDMAEELGILALSTAWGIASFSFGGLIYGLCKKYNK